MIENKKMLSLPLIGFGTYRLQTLGILSQTLSAALDSGYRLIDTASVYKNEEEIGTFLLNNSTSKVNRSDLFITSKIGPKDQGFDKALQAIHASLQNLGPASDGYIDLMLIHWPGTQNLPVTSPKNAENRQETWKALQLAQKKGLVRSIGVSNYTLKHLKEMDPLPALNQIEFHPLVYDDDMRSLLEYCTENGIVVQGYASLGEGSLVNGSMEIPELLEIAQRHGCTRAQILLQWSIRKGCPVIPKASTSDRIKENWDAMHVTLSDHDMHTLDHLIHKYGKKKFCWDPEKVL